MLLSVLCEVAAMKSGDHGNSHFAEEIAPVHQLRGFFFPFPVGGGDGASAADAQQERQKPPSLKMLIGLQLRHCSLRKGS